MTQDWQDHDGWILTQSGRQVWPMRLTMEDFHLADIAHSLAHQNRWGGHGKFFYSVAEHSCAVYFAMQERLQWDIALNRAPERTPLDDSNLRVWALFHDAVEAYLTDLPRPIKRVPAMGPYRLAERQGLMALAARLKLSTTGGDQVFPDMVAELDNLQLKREARDLMTLPLKEEARLAWHYLVTPPFAPGGRIVKGLQPIEARVLFTNLALMELRAHAELTGAKEALL